MMGVAEDKPSATDQKGWIAMKNAKFLAAIFFAAAMAGCTPSLNPLYTDKDLIFDPSLLGVWVSDEGDSHKTTWTFTRSGKNGYSMVSADDGEPARFDVALVSLGGNLYLDILPTEVPVENDFYKSLLIRAHTFAKVTVGEKAISVALMDPEGLKQQSGDEGQKLAQEKLPDGGVLLTAKTEDLQQYVLKHADDNSLFGESTVFRRVRSD
jgi:hypothetical protein